MFREESSVSDYKTELSSLNTKVLTIDSSICNLDAVISSLQSSTQTQEDKITSLESFHQATETFIAEAERIDSGVAELINKRKKEFYDSYSYLKPNSEKSRCELFYDGVLVPIGEWCKEHWKLIVTIVIVIAAIACLFIPGLNALVAGLVFGKLIFSMAIGALIGAGLGGFIGGIASAATGGSFFEGFENGAFSGTIAGLIGGGMGFGLSQSGTVALTLGRSLWTGAASGAGSSLLSDVGDILFTGANLSPGGVLTNMGISALFGAAFTGAGHGVTRNLATLFKSTSWLQNAREFFRIGRPTAKPDYNTITAYSTKDDSLGVSLNLANRAGNSLFRIELDIQYFLHYHAPRFFPSSTKVHIPLSPIIDSAMSTIASNNFVRR